MPLETAIIPTGIPNPIGPAVFQGVQNRSRIGGELPSQRYPLVCPSAMSYNNSASFMSQKQFERLRNITKPICPEPDPCKERLERLREKSQMLQLGWPDNNKDAIKRLAEKFLTNTNKDIDLREMEERKRIADLKPKKKPGFPKTLTGNDERHIKIKEGLVLSEVLAQRKEHEAIAKQFKALEEIREAELIQREYDLDHQLTEKHKAREARHKQYLKNIEAFQMTQIKKNKDDAKEAKVSSDKSRKAVVLTHEENAMKKAYKDHIEERNNLKDWGQYYQNVMTERAEHKKYLQDHDQSLLDLADDQDEKHHLFKMKTQYERKEKTIRNGAKQHRVHDLYRENVLLGNGKENIKKIVDAENAKIEREIIEDHLKSLKEEEESKEKKATLIDSLRHFKQEDLKIKNQRNVKVKRDIAEEKDVNEENFIEYLKRMSNNESNRMSKAQTLKEFWNKQCNELKNDRTKFRQDHQDYENAIKYSEDLEEDEFEVFAENVITQQKARGRDTYPIRKLKTALNLGKGPAIMALDNFDNKIYAQAKDTYYKPVDSRNRLSINWNPDDKTMEDKTIC